MLRELADTVSGTSANNALRMRLSAYVLAARLEKVATLANERLSGMGEGRYQLRHTDHLAARGARSGLGLEVLDVLAKDIHVSDGHHGQGTQVVMRFPLVARPAA